MAGKKIILVLLMAFVSGAFVPTSEVSAQEDDRAGLLFQQLADRWWKVIGEKDFPEFLKNRVD